MEDSAWLSPARQSDAGRAQHPDLSLRKRNLAIRRHISSISQPKARRRRLQRRCESNDPEFVAKAADVVGLYVDPPAKAIVLCVDEKPSIQALERAQGYWKLPNGRALTGQSHDDKRHGTTTTAGSG